MKKLLLLFYITTQLFSLGHAQSDQKYIDSLFTCLQKKDDSLKLDALSNLAWEYNQTDVNKAISLSKQGVSIAKKLNKEYAIGQAYSDLGTSYYYKRDFDSSALCYQQAEQITITTGDSTELASLYNKMGALYKERAEFTTSLKYSFESLNIYQSLKNDRKTALLLNNIGTTYEMLKNYSMALSYYKRSVELNSAVNNNTGLGRNYIGLGNIYTTLGKFEDALLYYEKAETIFRKENWLLELSATLNNIGNVYDEQKRFSESLEKRMEALDIAIASEDRFEEAKFHNYIADVLMKMGNFQEARKHIQKAQNLLQIIKSEEIEMDLYEVNAKYYFGTHDFEKGNEYLRKFHALKDSLYSAELSNNIAGMEVKHNTQKLRIEKAEAESKNLKLSNDKLKATEQRNIILLAAVLLAIIMGAWFYVFTQQRKQVGEKNRINAMLSSEEKERTRIARELHDGLGQLLSTARLNAASLEESVEPEDAYILENTLQLIDQSVNEVRSISHNLMPLLLSEKGLIEALSALAGKINSGKLLKVDFKHTGFSYRLDNTVEIAIYRVVQEVLNNMIKHSHADRITLLLENTSKELLIHITDNGKGFDTSLIEKSEGMGWRNILTRLSLINGKFGITSEPGKGTHVNINVTL